MTRFRSGSLGYTDKPENRLTSPVSRCVKINVVERHVSYVVVVLRYIIYSADNEQNINITELLKLVKLVLSIIIIVLLKRPI